MRRGGEGNCGADFGHLPGFGHLPDPTVIKNNYERIFSAASRVLLWSGPYDAR